MVKVRYVGEHPTRGPDGSHWDPRVDARTVKDLAKPLADKCLDDPRYERVAPKKRKKKSSKKSGKKK